MEEIACGHKPGGPYEVEVLKTRRLAERTYEIELSRPDSFEFIPGQRVRFLHRELQRDYSLTSTPSDDHLSLCVRKVEGGRFSPLLTGAEKGSRFLATGPHGYFIYEASPRHSVFVATGTGIAPFVSMVRAGVTGFSLLHGVKGHDDLYYESLLRGASRLYIPCLSEPRPDSPAAFRGRVTDWLEQFLAPAVYDFYLCGRGEMIRDALWLIDERFPSSIIHTETFY